MNISKPHLAIVGLIVLTVILISYYYYDAVVLNQKQPQPEPELQPQQVITPDSMDIFGINKIYPTTEGGREWFINMDDPLDDNMFFITSNVPIEKSDDDGLSWFINDPQIRMNVNTPSGESPWKNIEMTGYVKVRSIFNNSQGNEEETDSNAESLTAGITWRARGGLHNNQNPCEGTALNGGINLVDMQASWQKEIWHTGGYTNSRAITQATDDPSLDRWIGWKIVMYNIDNGSGVKMESYIDNDNKNKWIKVNELTDNGEWFANSSDEEFNSANCNKPKDYVITNSGPIATFRADNIAFDFKNLSIREIEPA